MLDALVWFFQQILLGFYNFFAAIVNMQSWLDWSDGQAIMRVVYYGASVELFFVVLNTIVDVTYAWVDPRLRDDTAKAGGSNG